VRLNFSCRLPLIIGFGEWRERQSILKGNRHSVAMAESDAPTTTTTLYPLAEKLAHVPGNTFVAFKDDE